MIPINDYSRLAVSAHNIDDEIINKLGIRLSNKLISAHIAPTARVFEFPSLKNVFIMESDFYGNIMPQGSCFLAFNGSHGFIGKHLKLDALRYASVADIKEIVEKNSEG